MPITDETRNQIFNTLQKHLEKCTPPMVVARATPNHGYELIGNKPVPYGYDKKIIPGMFFASILQRKDSVAFYFFPCSGNEKMLQNAPNLVKLLKGKTCFHFKKPEQINEKELDGLLKEGVKAWKTAGHMQ